MYERKGTRRIPRTGGRDVDRVKRETDFDDATSTYFNDREPPGRDVPPAGAELVRQVSPGESR